MLHIYSLLITIYNYMLEGGERWARLEESREASKRAEGGEKWILFVYMSGNCAYVIGIRMYLYIWWARLREEWGVSERG